MTTFQQYNLSPMLTPVRVVSTSNVSGTYFNGTLNNGVGATLTVAASSLTVDSVVLVVSDRVLLQAQTSANQNGIYVVNSIGTTVVLQRSADQQSIEQYKEGQYVTVGAGTVNAGSAFVLTETLPAILGINNMTWTASPLNSGLGTAAAKAASDNTKATVASVSAATVTGNLLKAADTAGTIADQGVAFKSVAGAAAAGGAAAQSFTDAFCTSGSCVVGNWNTQANAASVLKIVPGNGSFVVTSSADAGVGTFNYIITK